MRKIKALMVALVMVMALCMSAYGDEIYRNPNFYSDSAHFTVRSENEETFTLSVYESTTKELVSVNTVTYGERFIISFPGGTYDFIISSPTSRKEWLSFKVKRGGKYAFKRK